MSRYIDADAFVKLIDHYILHDKDAKKNHSALFIEGMEDGYYRIRSNIINFPSSDVVEVVRCEDCRYWENRFDVMVCNLTDGMKGTSDYCSYGERREQ